MASDQVRLTVPARDEFARTVRMTAAAILSRAEVSIDVLDDVKIAVEEAFIHACDIGGCEGDITFEFAIDDESLQIRVGPLAPSKAADPGEEVADRYSRFILESVCDEFETTSDETATFIRVLKRFDES